jgi:UDP-2,4-diacetamido-2,4,6-trideoxy-beta-L-altropyranose hydrolase
VTAPGPLAVFRLDARPESGLGHLSRCGALADALRDAGWHVAAAFRAKKPPADPHSFLNPAILGDEDGAEVLRRRWPDGCDLLVVDDYTLDAGFESACRGWARRILAMDDGTGRQHDCDLLLDAAASYRGEAYRPLTPAGCTILAGPSFALLPDETRRTRRTALARDRSGTPRRAALYLGGAEDGRLTSRLLDALAAIDPVLELDIILPSIAGRSLVAARPAAHPLGVRVHSATPSLVPIFEAADIAIGAAGVTAWERCCLGLPSLAIVTAENQRGVAAYLRKTGSATVSERTEAEDPVKLRAVLSALLTDGEARRIMARAAADLCDGDGPRRVVEALAQGISPARHAAVGRC